MAAELMKTDSGVPAVGSSEASSSRGRARSPEGIRSARSSDDRHASGTATF